MRRLSLIVLGALALSACDSPGTFSNGTVNRSVDRGIDSKDLTELKAGIWIDPNGCDHWIIDDGFEGYMSQRLDPYGKPVCSGLADPNMAVRDFKRGSGIPDVF
jgi:hypothetical protein